MMRLSVESCEIRDSFGDEEAIRLIKASGFDCVDYSFYFAEGEKYMLGEDYRERAIRLRGVLDEVGLVCNQAHAPFVLMRGEPLTGENPRYLELLRSIEFASILGAPHIVVHALGDSRDADFFELNAAYYRGLEPYCERFNIRIAIENLFGKGERFATPEAMRAILDTLGLEHFVGLIDVGHAAISADVVGIGPAEFIGGMDSSTLGGLHIQDNDCKSDLHTIPYLGKLDWNGIMRSLAEIGYSGDLTLEIIRFLKSMGKDLQPDALRFAAKVGRYLIQDFTEKCERRVSISR